MGLVSEIGRDLGRLSAAELAVAIEHLSQLLGEHFAYEEGLITGLNFQRSIFAADAHLAVHRQLLGRVAAMGLAVNERARLVSDWNRLDIGAVLVEEIARHDGELVAALARAGQIRHPNSSVA